VDVSAKHPDVIKDLKRRMEAFVQELEQNTRPIGKIDGAPEPEQTKKKKRTK